MCKTWVKAMEKLCSTNNNSSTDAIEKKKALFLVLISRAVGHKLPIVNPQMFQQLNLLSPPCYLTTFPHYPHSLLLTMTK